VHLDAPTAQQRREAVAIAVVNLSGRQWIARLTQFIAAAEQANLQRAVDLDPRNASAGQQTHFLRTQAFTGLEQKISPTNLLTFLAHVIANAYGREPDALALDPAALLRHHCVGTRR